MANEVVIRHSEAESVSPAAARLAGDHSSQYGVSDQRRRELAKMEQDAGVQHEAADESVPQKPSADEARLADDNGTADAARPGDRH